MSWLFRKRRKADDEQSTPAVRGASGSSSPPPRGTLTKSPPPPAPAAPRPVAVVPEPVAVVPEPVAVVPEPVVVEPEPVVVEPEPVVVEPEPEVVEAESEAVEPPAPAPEPGPQASEPSSATLLPWETATVPTPTRAGPRPPGAAAAVGSPATLLPWEEPVEKPVLPERKPQAHGLTVVAGAAQDAPAGERSPKPVALHAVQPAQEDETPTGLTAPSSRGRSARFIGDVVVDLGYADRRAVDQAVSIARATGKRTGQVLLESGVISADQLSRVIAERFGVDHVDLGAFRVDMTAANLIGSEAARRYEAVPVSFMGSRSILVAMVDPGNVLAIDDISLITGLEVRPAATAREDIVALVGRLNRLDDVVIDATEQAGEEEIEDLRETAEDAPVVKLVHSLIAQGVDQGASDIHFEPVHGDIVVRYRIDGVLSEATRIPKRLASGVISRIKIMSDLDIAERRAPQDGRVALMLDSRHVDVRVATLPLVGGEAAVLRVLDKDGMLVDLDTLGFQPDARAAFERAYTKPHGAVLVSGPTGSGKTTTLYGALQHLHTPDKAIITIEDPVEYELPGVKQMQVNVKAGVTFGSGLRSMMRADPDIIMVGEIRDRETAQIAIEAALTGHLVLSTLHTNDAPTAIARLIDMGIEPFLVASAIDCVVAQRLARTLCANCKRHVRVEAAVVVQHGFAVDGDVDAYEPVGCSRCAGTGYKGRVGLYEVMILDDEIRRLAVRRASADEVAVAAVAAGMRRLRDDGFDKVRAGLTSFAEIARVTS